MRKTLLRKLIQLRLSVRIQSSVDLGWEDWLRLKLLGLLELIGVRLLEIQQLIVGDLSGGLVINQLRLRSASQVVQHTSGIHIGQLSTTFRS